MRINTCDYSRDFQRKLSGQNACVNILSAYRLELHINLQQKTIVK